MAKTAEQWKAHQKVRAAVIAGVLVRPETCERCGEKPTPCVNGTPKIQGHHHDYNKPLDVEWICAKCHRKENPPPPKPVRPAFGESNGQAKLTVQQVKEIRASPLGCRRLAKAYGVSKRTVQFIRRGETWAA